MNIVRRASAGVAIAAAGLLVGASPAAATWSVVAVDSESGEVGVAIASCVTAAALGDLDAPFAPVVLVPGVGAGVTQGALNEVAGTEIARLLAEGAEPDDIIDVVTSLGFDADAAHRQHAVVSVDGSTSAFTGDENLDTALDRQADGVSVQGNILVDATVVTDAISAFEDEAGTLTDRLVAALIAGARAGGDARCRTQTALFAQVAVASPDDVADEPTVLLTFVTDRETGDNPVELLAAAQAEGASQAVDEPQPDRPIRYRLVAIAGALMLGAGLAVRWRRHRDRDAAHIVDEHEPEDQRNEKR